MNNQIVDKLVGAIGGLIAFCLILFVIALIIGFPVMWLYNYCMPYMFGLKEIDFWHALWFSVLCGMLFGNKSSNASKDK